MHQLLGIAILICTQTTPGDESLGSHRPSDVGGISPGAHPRGTGATMLHIRSVMTESVDRRGRGGGGGERRNVFNDIIKVIKVEELTFFSVQSEWTL